MAGPPEKPWMAALRSVLPRLRHVTLGVRAVVHWDGRLVLVRHRFHDRGRWYLPGGGVDAHEDAAQAVLRETQEEAGIPASQLSLRSVHGVFLNEMTGWDDHVLVFVADAAAAPCTLPLSWEVVEARAFEWGALPELSPGTERRLQDVRAALPLRSGRW